MIIKIILWYFVICFVMGSADYLMMVVGREHIRQNGWVGSYCHVRDTKDSCVWLALFVGTSFVPVFNLMLFGSSLMMFFGKAEPEGSGQNAGGEDYDSSSGMDRDVRERDGGHRAEK